MTKRAAIYVRVSSEAAGARQGQPAPAAQDEAQDKPARAREGLPDLSARHTATRWLACYRDTEKYRASGRMVEPSGTRADRPQLKRMIADADAGSFDVLIAWREDRLYRAFRPMLDVLDCIERNGINRRTDQ